jgi:DNA modification methylase
VRRPNLVFFASRLQLRDYLNWAHAHDLNWSLICWHKTNPIPLTAAPYLPDTEYALHFTRGTRVGGCYHSKRRFYVQPSGKSSFDHPTVKPLNIVKNLLLNAATAPGSVVLDPFMGSGTSGVAAIQLGHKFIGIEMNGDYLAIAKRRIAQASPDFQLTIDLTAKDTTREHA